MTDINNKTFRLGSNETRKYSIKATAGTVIIEGTALMLDETDGKMQVWTDTGKPIVAFCNRTFTMPAAAYSVEDVVISGKVRSSMLIMAGLTTASFPTQGNLASKEILIPFENLAAGADIAARPAFISKLAAVISEVGILTQGAPAGVDDANTAVIAITDSAGNSIVSKTYNTANQPPDAAYASLGTVSATHGILTAGEVVKAAVTQGATADLPAFFLFIRYKEIIPATKNIAFLLAETGIEAIDTLENRY
jgi:hypothetical protein